MIEDKDCCDNCIEGIEPCCDEELQEHIEEQLVEQSEPEQQPQFVDLPKKSRLAEELARHLCCQNKFYIIYKAMHDMSTDELTQLRDDLRKFTPKNELHPHLEGKFRHAINKSIHN